MLNVKAKESLSLYDLTCEYQVNPLGIDQSHPRLSWKIRSDEMDVFQTAYEIRVTTDPKSFVHKGLSWTSGKVSSDQSVHIAYQGNELKSGQRYYWQVRIWDNKGHASSWSTVNFWEMGLLAPSDWKAKWIQYTKDTPKASGPSPMFRKAWNTNGKIKQARLYITSYGLYEAYINGKRVGDAYFTPGWTSFHKQLQYQVYDVSSLVKSGDNAIGVSLGDGWFRGNLMGGRNFWGKDLSLLAQLVIEYTNGEQQLIISDDSWKTSLNGPILLSDIYDGERYDARKEIANWSTAEYNAQQWQPALVNDTLSYEHLISSAAPLVKTQEHIKPVKIITTPKGEKVIDFGQNLVGWVNFHVKGQAGDSVVISHAEVLDKEGNFYIENLRRAKQQLTYTLKGGAEEHYHPHFSFQGFRYIKIDGAKELIDLANIEAVVLHSDMQQTGTFETSNALINQLQHNIQWGQKGNFVDVPTDCPQRDERLGWTGDAQAFFTTAAYNRDVAGFFIKWLKDVKADQFKSGAIPHVVPYMFNGEQGGSAGWADVATIIPWNFYQVYGDEQILKDQYTSMVNWVQFMTDNSTDGLWNKGWHFGDWLFYVPNDDRDGRAAITDKYLIAQCFYAHSAQLMINAASVLHKSDDKQRYEQLLEKIKKAFLHEFVTPSGRLVSSSQTAYVLALNFDLLPENMRAEAAKRLVENIRSYDNHLTTGFLGTPYLCHVLSRFGYLDVAYQLLLQETYPSWLYPVKMGATTIWERWDGIKPDGTFQNKDMNSFNHYAYGAIGDWMYKNIAGIQPDEIIPGYKQFRIAPKPGGEITSAKADFESVYGKISSSWRIENNTMHLEIEVPPNTKAKLVFPDIKTGEAKDEKGKTLADQDEWLTSGKHSVTFNVK
ncbi:glycoside hydrolase family 78 protein [Olivibacter ginsenosidimutans]|uniref:glycoside hydrolase family 78 protein n=1 Tax=Olivibacter ginsenosidimutans TaxID=1176537 RepID=UPI0031E9757C